MRWSDINRNPTPAMLRQFALIWLLFFLGLAAWQAFVAGRPLLGVFLALLALTIGPLGLIWPSGIRGLYVGLMVLTFPIGWTISQVMLLLLFYGIFTPLAFIFRLQRRDFLLRRRQERDSFWLVKTPPADIRSYFRQS